MKIAIVLPRGMYFGPDRATAIDLCVRDSVRHSAFLESTQIFGVAVDRPFNDVPFEGVSSASTVRIRDFVSAIASWKPELIVVHQHLRSARAIAEAYPSVPTILYKHNSVRGRRSKLKMLLEKRKFNVFSHIIFVSDFCRTSFLEDFNVNPCRVSAVHNGLDVSAWIPKKDRKKIALFVGRATPEKGAVEAASAIARAFRDHPDWQAGFLLSTLDGNNDYLAAIRNALQPLGSRGWVQTDVPFSAVKAHMEEAAIVLAPSLFEEPFGRTAIEAMAGGAALMSSFRGGLAEVCGDAARKVCPDDILAFSDAISELIGNPALRADLSARGRQRVERHFSIQETALHLDSIYRRVLRARS